MVAPNREIMNINFSSYNSAISHLVEVNTISKDININKLRGKFKLSNLNSFRESLVHLDISSISYMDRIEAQSNCQTYKVWT